MNPNASDKISNGQPHIFVEEANLTHHISALRKVLGEDDNGRKFIETITHKGC